MKGHYNRWIACEQCGTEFHIRNRVCPKCGHERALHPATLSNDKAKAEGHVRGPYKKTGAANQTWTVSIANGKETIAANISPATVKRILILIGEGIH